MHARLVSGPISSAVPLLDEQGMGGKVLLKIDSSTDSSGDEQSSEPLNTLPSTESGVLPKNVLMCVSKILNVLFQVLH